MAAQFFALFDIYNFKTSCLLQLEIHFQISCIIYGKRYEPANENLLILFELVI